MKKQCIVLFLCLILMTMVNNINAAEEDGQKKYYFTQVKDFCLKFNVKIFQKMEIVEDVDSFSSENEFGPLFNRSRKSSKDRYKKSDLNLMLSQQKEKQKK
ncbi:MAG: hypothetical protein WCD44_00760 [Candidatus Babeliales bacterium]